MKNKITVIIVTYKTNKKILEDCLNSIDKNIKVIIIDLVYYVTLVIYMLRYKLFLSYPR